MSLSEMYISKNCNCGMSYITDVSTLGLNRNRCSICELKERIERLEDIVGLVHYVVYESTIKDISINDMTKSILNGLIPKRVIENGLKKVNLDNIYYFFNKTTLGAEIKKDLKTHLEYDPNLSELVNNLINYLQDNSDSNKVY